MKAWIIAALLVAASVPTANAQPYDLRGFKLGMTMDEFLVMQHPDGHSWLRIMCTGNPDAAQATGGAELRVSSTEAKIGVVRCNHFRNDYGTGTARLTGFNMDVAGVKVFQRFEFVPDPASAELRLFRIVIDSNMDYWDQFWSAYNEKFGKPASLKTEKVQNGAGATFDKVVAVWANKESSILLEQRAAKINLMRIVYEESALAAYVAQKTEAIEGRPSDKL